MNTERWTPICTPRRYSEKSDSL